MTDEGVLLLNAVPGLLSFNSGVVPNLESKVSEVGVGRNEYLAVVVLPVVGFAHDQDVVAASEGVSVVGNWLEDDFTLVSDSLVGAATIVVPVGDISEAGNFGLKCSAF